MLLQLKCESCSAFIVLQVNIPLAAHQEISRLGLQNASSTISVSEEEMHTLRTALDEAGGSFQKLFERSSTLS